MNDLDCLELTDADFSAEMSELEDMTMMAIDEGGAIRIAIAVVIVVIVICC